MFHLVNLRRVSLLTLPLFFLTGCLFEKCDEWQTELIVGSCPQFNASKLFFQEDRIANALEIELRRSSEGDLLFLNLNSFYVECSESSDGVKEAELEISFFFNEEERQKASLFVLLGGQRLRFQEETASLIIERLLNGDHCTVILGKREFLIPSSNFLKLYST